MPAWLLLACAIALLGLWYLAAPALARWLGGRK
jgi:hypothetical protein